ncbi:MAG: DUF4198 domain-containing protein [Pseudomonadota bacterium]
MKQWMLVGALSLLPTAAMAHVGFLLPNTFHIEDGETVTAIASFSDHFPSSEHVLKSRDFHVLVPGGKRQSFADVATLDQLTVLTAEVKDTGVYRLSSGERLGRKGQVSRVDGSLVRLGADGIDLSSLPDGAPLLSSQTATVSEAFIRKGEATLPSTLTTSGRLSISVTSERGAQFVPGSLLQVSALFDGQPLKAGDVTIVSAFGSYTAEGEGRSFATDDQGHATLSVDRAGPHVVFVRHMAEAPEGAETDVRSYTTALVFEVLPSAE